MSEELKNTADFGENRQNGWDSLKQENLSDYDLAVKEVLADYASRTPFEQKVMRDIVIGERLMKDFEFKDWQGRDLTKEGIKERLEHDFESGMNCGGFALEVNTCLFSGSDNIEEATKNILAQFPFVRVKGETELGPNEYQVYYRHAEGGLAHHFIKEVGDKIMEKDGNGPVREFTGWAEVLKDAPEVVLVVNREHEIEPRDENGEVKHSFVI